MHHRTYEIPDRIKVALGEDLDAPTHLSQRAKTLWHAIVPKQVLSAGRRALLQSGLEALDRVDSARAAIEADGLLWTPRGKALMAHAHPALAIEKEARSQFVTVWSKLGLGHCVAIDGFHLSDEHLQTLKNDAA